MTAYVTDVAPKESASLSQQQCHQLLCRLRETESHKVADRIEYLASVEIAEDGGGIPAIASIVSFVAFYFNNRDLDEPFLGTTPNGELQAVRVFPDRRRLIAEFLTDDTVRCVYRRAGDVGSSKPFLRIKIST